jgi:hypothetical protein
MAIAFIGNAAMPVRWPWRKRYAVAVEVAGPRSKFQFKLLIYLVFGAGEGIRTLDPNLGKVVLYP